MAGASDDGKRTLFGRLLLESAGCEREREAFRQSAPRSSPLELASAAADLALVIDELPLRRGLSLSGHPVQVIDPAVDEGRVDVTIVLVDARLGVMPETVRCLAFARARSRRVLACVNKMDLVHFSEDVFERIRAELRACSPLDREDVVPISALTGDNVARVSARMPWWRDGALVDQLEWCARWKGGADER